MEVNDIPDITAQLQQKQDYGLQITHKSETTRKAAEPATPYGRDRKGKCFLVPADEIRANKYDLSISRYKEIEHKEIEYEKPGVIMDKVVALERDIAKDVEEIRKLVGTKVE